MPIESITRLFVLHGWTVYLKIAVLEFNNFSSTISFIIWVFLVVCLDQVNSTSNICLWFKKVLTEGWLRPWSTLVKARISNFVIPSSTVRPVFHASPNRVDRWCHVSKDVLFDDWAVLLLYNIFACRFTHSLTQRVQGLMIGGLVSHVQLIRNDVVVASPWVSNHGGASVERDGGDENILNHQFINGSSCHCV